MKLSVGKTLRGYSFFVFCCTDFIPMPEFVLEKEHVLEVWEQRWFITSLSLDFNSLEQKYSAYIHVGLDRNTR